MPTHTRLWRATVCALLVTFIAACSNSTPPRAAQNSPSAAASSGAVAAASAGATASAAPATPAAWVFPAGSTIAGVDVSGRTPSVAIGLVSLGIARMQQPLPLTQDWASADNSMPAIKPRNVGLALDVPKIVQQAEADAKAGKPVNVAWTPQVDAAKLRAAIEALAPEYEQVAATDVITDEDAITQTFTFRARDGIALDVQATADLVAPLLLDRTQTPTATVVLKRTTPEPRDLQQLKQVLEQHATYWKGLAGFYVQDLETGETIGINENTVFSGASVMKVPIMIYAYAQLGKLNDKQREWMEGMIIESDNIDANALLAAAAGGVGTEKALEGVEAMTEMLKGLGLERTYQLIPYESGEWLIQQSRLPRGGPTREGAAPYTRADPYVRTTPREMGELFVMLAECTEGRGPLIETFPDTINKALCDEMMAWLERPHDQERMVAGIPANVPVAHKGGWIDDMQSDVGIVSSPNGRYVAAIYIWRPDGYVTNVYADPSPYLGDFSHTIYSFFNPEPIP